MVTTASTSSSLKEYLKKYENSTDEEKKKKKKKKKKAKAVASGVLVVDEDPVWQKPMNLEEEEENDSPDERPQINEDIEVKRMRRLEMARLTHNRISEDGSGWVPVSDIPKRSTSIDRSSDASPPRMRKARNDTPSPDSARNPSDSGRVANDLSPPRHRRRRNDSPSPGPQSFDREESDLSPPRQHRQRNDSPSPAPDGGGEHSDLSPPRQRRRVIDPPLPLSESISLKAGLEDLSPPRKRGRRNDSPSLDPNIEASDAANNDDLSPPRRRGRNQVSPLFVTTRKSVSGDRDSESRDLSPPRRARRLEDLSPPRKSQKGINKVNTRDGSSKVDLSPPRKSKEKKTGLITGKDVTEEIAKIKEEEWLRFNSMDPSTSGRDAEGVYRFHGKRVSKDEYLKLTKKADKSKTKEEKKLEWGKGLAQKREAEERLHELELEKAKPFARTRDDPDLDRMMKDRLRWGDPMAHLVKRKQSDLVLPDLGDSEKMKESGFIVPQDIPSHSWLKRGIDYEPNRFGIKPGRHWDGQNRSNGYENQMFKRMSEKKATEREAYLWSVSDM